jgi:hypothetical protein
MEKKYSQFSEWKTIDLNEDWMEVGDLNGERGLLSVMDWVEVLICFW